MSITTNKLSRLDRDVFRKGLEKLQAHVDRRVFVTVLSFAQELGEVISDGIASTPTSSSETSSVSRFAAADAPPAKISYSDMRDRRKLGKRILKAVQPILEAALKVEAEISSKSIDTLLGELEALMETGLEASQKQEAEEEDTIMVDAPDSSEITVRGGHGAVTMDVTDEDGRGDNIEVNTSGLGIVNVKAEESSTVVPSPRKSKRGKGSGMQTSETTPDSNDYDKLSRTEGTGGPPTPPLSNGSMGKEPHGPLGEGGVLWYMKDLQPVGTSVVVDSRDDVYATGTRLLSEDEASDPDDEGPMSLRGGDKKRVPGNSSPSKTRKRRVSGRRR